MLKSGQTLSAKYLLVRQLGMGGSATIWLAEDRDRHVRVALKVLDAGLAQNPDAVQALRRECEHTASLRHMNILDVAGVESSPEGVWIVMEYAAGGDLRQLRGVATTRIVQTVIPIADALGFAHEAGIVHRDLKPANVLLRADGTVRVADFGMSLLVEQSPAANAGRGSEYNMSPQQLDGAPAAAADDIYAFGVLLYELLSGYPPFYPDVNAARIRNEVPVSLPSRSDLPPALSDLVSRCLRKDPQQRPQGMRQIGKELTAILAQLPALNILNESSRSAPPVIAPPAARPSMAQGQPLRGEWQRPNQSGADAADLRRQGFRRGLFVAALVLGIVGIGVVFFALPKWVAPAPTTAAQPVAKDKSATPAEPAKEVDFAELARAKQKAEEQREPFDERMKKLQALGAEQWGAEDFQKATAAFAAADQQFAARDYVATTATLDTIEPLLKNMERRIGVVLAEQLKAGAAALNDGRSADARAAFTLAQRIDGGNKAAATGLKRAGTLDQVLKILAEAERQEKDGDVVAASAGYAKALALDGLMARASEGAARTQSRIAGDNFASAMAQGFNALTRTDYKAARSAFEAAGKIRPNAPEVAQGLKQIEQDERTRTIAAKLETASGYETQEKWAEAVQEYQAVVQLDNTVAAANEGLARARPRFELNQQLEIYITQPERLFSAPVRTAAKDSLARARSITNPGPVLVQQISKLTDWLARAEVPVPVAFQSDNQTKVSIRRVGELGSFEQRSMELAPGSYIVVGTRPGYRDVRREIMVKPGSAPDPLIIRCEEKI
jgi:tetratricopeptide (TPR) repeat protein